MSHLCRQWLFLFSPSQAGYKAVSEMSCGGLEQSSPLGRLQLWSLRRQKWISQAYIVGGSGKTALGSKIFISQQETPELELQNTHAITSLGACFSCGRRPSCEPHTLSQGSDQNKIQCKAPEIEWRKHFPSAYSTMVFTLVKAGWLQGVPITAGLNDRVKVQ